MKHVKVMLRKFDQHKGQFLFQKTDTELDIFCIVSRLEKKVHNFTNIGNRSRMYSEYVLWVQKFCHKEIFQSSPQHLSFKMPNSYKHL